MSEQALSNWLQSWNHSISAVEADDGSVALQKDDFWTWLGRGIFPSQDSEQIDRVSTILGDNLVRLAADPDIDILNSEELRLAEAYVWKHRDDHRASGNLSTLDHRIAQIKNGVEVATGLFMVEGKRQDFARWQRYGFDPQIYLDFPEFADFMLRSNLASQMKVTRDTIFLVGSDDEGTREPAIMVEGSPMPWSELKERFEMKWSGNFQDLFINERATNRVFFYLDTGEGLVAHNPFLFNQVVPLSTVSASELARVHESAKSFVRPSEAHLSERERQELNNDGRDYTIQIVSSRVDEAPEDHWLLGGVNAMFRNAKHPYIRLVDNVGNVYCWGYGWHKPTLPMTTSRGQFRGPDHYEYKKVDRRFVTNIAVSEEEAQKLQRFILRYQNDSHNYGNRPAFNLAWQNCTVFVATALEAATGIVIPKHITIDQLMDRITPPIFSNIAAFFSRVGSAVMRPLDAVYNILPTVVQNGVSWVADKVRRATNTVFAFIGTALLVALGAAFGTRGRQFNTTNRDQVMEVPLQQPENWFNPQLYGFHSPKILQEWQQEQASTVRYDETMKLSIVPGGRDASNDPIAVLAD